VPVLEEHRTRRVNKSEGDLLVNLAFCADELEEIHLHCARAYPNFEVPFSDFRDAVANAALKYLTLAKRETSPSRTDLRRFIGELHAADLYLGLGCIRGDEHAWWEFDRQYRAFIESWTRHLVRSGADANEIIDAVYVELFGTKVTGGVRQSKFRTFTGRGTLRSWLRTIIMHAAVDMYRASKDEVPLEDWSGKDESQNQKLIGRETEDSMLTSIVRDRYRTATIAALDQALVTLDDHETLLLLYYHVEGLKLREIARIVEEPRSPIRRWFQRRGSQRSRVHESTVMRWLERVYRKVSERFSAELAGKHGLKPEEIEICKKIAAEDPAQTITISNVKEGSKTKDRVSVESAS